MACQLTPRQARFVEEYLVDLNATQAAIRAGYSAATADQQASRLLANVKVARAIAAGKAERSAETKVNAAYVVTNLVEVIERAMQRAPVVNPFSGEQVKDDDGRNVWRHDGKVAVAALALLAKHTGGFVERQEHTGKDGAPLAPALVVVPATVEDLDEWRRRHESKT